MKKKIALLLMTLTIVASLVGCVGEVENDGKDSNIESVQVNRFAMTGDYYSINEAKFSVVVDTQTKNLYLYKKSMNSYGDVSQMTPLYDENGKIQKQK